MITASEKGPASAGGNGNYHNSHTWFEASILRPVSIPSDPAIEDVHSDGKMRLCPIPPTSHQWFLQKEHQFIPTPDGRGIVWHVHNNVTAQEDPSERRVKWRAGERLELGEDKESMRIGMGDGEGFVQSLRSGDRVALWARAEVRFRAHFATYSVCPN